MSVIYLDNNATTCVAPEVYEPCRLTSRSIMATLPVCIALADRLLAPTSESRAIAALIHAEANEIIFTSCGTEGDNAAIRAALDRQPDKRHIITTAVEHPAILKPLQRLEKQGYSVTYLGVDGKGQLKLEELRRAIRDDTALISVMAANNETGTIFPIERIGHLAKERGVLFHVDAVQAAGKIPLDVSSGVIDFLVLSGHKFHGPKGIGVLYVRRGVRFRPFLAGGIRNGDDGEERRMSLGLSV